jgi:5-(carboxyamino)imidazole ribonucleotide mutase/phosphoribosylaminoimidazole-succinocarboxamide synthase
MPSGIAPAVVLDPANAALLAAKIFGVTNAEIRERVRLSQKQAADKIIGEDSNVH